METVWPLAVYFIAVVALSGFLLVLTHLLGERRRRAAPDIPYESGMPPTGSARLRFSADFYLLAMFFVVFDIQAVFVFAWAVAARALGWAGYVELVVFLAVLVSGLAYLWRRGAFDWTSRRGRAGSSEGGR